MEKKLNGTVGAAIAYLEKMPEWEPVFILRGRDPLAVGAIQEWIEEALAKGVHSVKVAAAKDVKEEMERWKTKKLPG